MTMYVVARVGQLKEHDTIQSARTEAIRLAVQNDNKYHVLEVAGTIVTERQTVWVQADVEPTPFRKHSGDTWSREDDVNLVRLFYTGEHDRHRLADHFGRTPLAISCRLAKHGIIV